MKLRNCSEATIPRGFSQENPEFCKIGIAFCGKTAVVKESMISEARK